MMTLGLEPNKRVVLHLENMISWPGHLHSNTCSATVSNNAVYLIKSYLDAEKGHKTFFNNTAINYAA